MKHKIFQLKRIIPIAIFCMVLGSALFQNSCKTEDIGAPVITRVRFLDPTTADSSITSAALGKWLVIQGSNFDDIQEVYFNNLKASFNPTLVTSSNIVIVVPDTTPTLATDSAHAVNELKVITKRGIATFTLTILPPPPILDSVSNEFAHAGEEITIYGKYFYFVQSVKFPGGIEGTDIITESSGKTCKVKVPAGIILGGELIVRSESGISSIGRPCNFNDTTNIFFDCEKGAEINLQGSNGVKFYNGAENPDIKSVRGKYALAYVDEISPGTPWVAASAFESAFRGDRFTYPNYTNDTQGSNLELRFEINIKDTWNSGFFEIAFLSDSTVSAWKNAYRASFYPPIAKTNGWITVRLPLTKFTIFSNDGGTTELIGTTVPTYAQIKGRGFNWNFKNTGAAAGGLTIAPLNVAMDNFRIIKLK